MSRWVSIVSCGLLAGVVMLGVPGAVFARGGGHGGGGHGGHGGGHHGGGHHGGSHHGHSFGHRGYSHSRSFSRSNGSRGKHYANYGMRNGKFGGAQFARRNGFGGGYVSGGAGGYNNGNWLSLWNNRRHYRRPLMQPANSIKQGVGAAGSTTASKPITGKTRAASGKSVGSK